jgi:NitT/TauT family transport system substrate-binding protein
VLLVAKGAQGQELPTLRVAGPSQEGFKTVYYGVRAGVFKKYGVNVEIVPVGSGAAALAALAGGSIQVALTSTIPFFQAYTRGLPFQIVAPGQQYVSDYATQALFVKKDSPIRRGSDLNGKVIAVQSIKDLNWAATLAWIDSTGGDSQRVKVIELPLAAVTPAIAEGRIDAGTLSAPYLQQGIATGSLRLLAKDFDILGKRFEVAVYIASKDYVAANRDAMTRFARAMQESAIYVNTHPAETVDLIALFTGVDPAIIAKAARTTDPEVVDPKDLQPTIDLAFKYKLLERAFSAEEIIGATALRPAAR